VVWRRDKPFQMRCREKEESAAQAGCESPSTPHRRSIVFISMRHCCVAVHQKWMVHCSFVMKRAVRGYFARALQRERQRHARCVPREAYCVTPDTVSRRGIPFGHLQTHGHPPPAKVLRTGVESECRPTARSFVEHQSVLPCRRKQSVRHRRI
jgi:hypothetical protein